MKKFNSILIAGVMVLALVACGGVRSRTDRKGRNENSSSSKSTASEESVTEGTEKQRGFINNNVLHSENQGDIHFSSYIPDSYDGSSPYALFITLPGWDGLYLQGAGANMDEDFGTEAIKYNDRMIVLSPQLSDWGNKSADQAIALTEYFLSHYNIDKGKVYLHGYSAGGETGSRVMNKRPDLYTAFLCCSTKWDGGYSKVTETRTPVYFAVGEDDSYYGAEPIKQAYNGIKKQYEDQGLSDSETDKLVRLDMKPQSYFESYGYSDQHAGGQAFAHDQAIMGWLFGEH